MAVINTYLKIEVMRLWFRIEWWLQIKHHLLYLRENDYRLYSPQVHIVKKSNKWECKMCGEKQSIKKVLSSIVIEAF